MTRRWLSGPAWGFWLGFLALPVQAGERQEFPLKYRVNLQLTQEVGATGQPLRLTARKAALKEEPPYRSREPLYAALALGVKGEPFTLVLDSSAGTAGRYDTLYLDADRSGRITSAQKLPRFPGATGRVFGPAKLLVDSGGEKSLQTFVFRLREFTSDDGAVVRTLVAINAGSYQGLVSFGGPKRLVAVVDADGNGLYNDQAKGVGTGGDRLLIDLNGDGKLDTSPSSEEVQPLGRYVLVGDRYWQLDVAPDGSAVTVAPLDKHLGTIRTSLLDYTLLLRGEEGLLRVRGKAGAARVPAGRYRLTQWTYRLADPAGRAWAFTGQGPEGTALVVRAGGEVRLPLGPPLVPKITVSPPEDGRVSLLLTVTGAGGETYTEVLRDGRENAPVPKGRIMDAAGRELAVVVFHYG